MIALTTANGSGLIVVGILTQTTGPPVSVSGLGLTWTATNAGGFTLTSTDIVYFFTAPYATNVSGNITVTNTAAVYQVSSALQISGAKTTSFLDGTVQTSAAGAPAITTSNANDCVVTSIETAGAVSGAGTGWTGCINAAGANFGFMEYQFPAATGTYTASILRNYQRWNHHCCTARTIRRIKMILLI